MVIKDKAIEPYVIEVDKYNYTVYIPKKSKNGEILRNNVRFYADLKNALLYIAEQQLIDTKQVVTLKEFLIDYREIIDRLVSSISVEK